MPTRVRDTLARLVADLVRRPWLRVDATHYLDDYEDSQWLAPAKLAELQRAKLRRLVWHCLLEVPHWARTLPEQVRPSEIERLDRLEVLPVGRLEARRADQQAFVARGGPRPALERVTAGTSGPPQRVLLDAESVERQRAVRLRAEGWVGASTGRVVSVGPPEAIEAPRALDEAELRALVTAVGRVRGAVVAGPGGSLAALARVVSQAGPRRQPIGVAAVIARGADAAGGGPRLAALLGAPLFRWYAAAEVGLIAAPCDRADRGALHVAADHLLLEVVDAAGRPVPPGERGRVLVTDLHNYAAPYLRHELGDEGRLLSQPCRCGRALPLFELVGRAPD